MTRHLGVLLLVGMCLLAVACAEGGSSRDIARPLDRTPLGPNQVVQHLLDPPSFGGDLAAVDVVEAELREENRYDRHLVFVAQVPEGTEASAPRVPEAGAVILVPEGSALQLEDAASVASLDGDAVTAVAACPAPCRVDGRAMVAPEGWLQGLAVDDGWLLLVPAPEDE